MNLMVATGGEDARQTPDEAFDSLVGAARAGAPWAFERLYRELAPAVAGYLRMQGALDPEDLTSDVFLNVFTGMGRFTGTGEQFRSWVFTIAHHRLVDDRRRLARRPQPADGDPVDLVPSPAGDAEGEAMKRLSVQRVRALCDRLAPDQRDVLLLRMVGDLTLEQTAETLGKSVGAVKALQHRSVAALRRLVEREGVSL